MKEKFKKIKNKLVAIGAAVVGFLALIIALLVKFVKRKEELAYNEGFMDGKDELMDAAYTINNKFGIPYVVANTDTKDVMLIMREEMLNTYADAAVKSMKKE